MPLFVIPLSGTGSGSSQHSRLIPHLPARTSQSSSLQESIELCRLQPLSLTLSNTCFLCPFNLHLLQNFLFRSRAATRPTQRRPAASASLLLSHHHRLHFYNLSQLHSNLSVPHPSGFDGLSPAARMPLGINNPLPSSMSSESSLF